MVSNCTLNMRGTHLLVALALIDCISISMGLGRKYQTKCEEYAESVFAEEESPVLSRKSTKQKVSLCSLEVTPLVIGGLNAQPKEFPHMAVLGYPNVDDKNVIEWKCGGTLISPTFVLSAAHCMRFQSLQPVIVRLGEVSFKTKHESKIQDKKIIQIFTHPKYKGSTKYNDIALLKLESSVIFDAYVRPACLNTIKHLTQPTAIATGFGKTSFDAMEGSDKLMKVTLNIMNNSDCTKYFQNEVTMGSLSEGVSDTMVCAGELKGGKDTCQGDSGGPLQTVLDKPYCMYSVIGIISFGKFCGFANQPAIYTNIAYYIDWIEGIVWV